MHFEFQQQKYGGQQVSLQARAELEREFRRIDADESGTLEQAELAAVLDTRLASGVAEELSERPHAAGERPVDADGHSICHRDAVKVVYSILEETRVLLQCELGRYQNPSR